jgi:hypothetical protein
LSQLFDRDFDVAGVSAARLASGLTLSVSLILSLSDGLSDLALALSDAARTLRSMTEVRDLDIRYRDRHQPPPLPPGHLTVSDVPAQVFADPSFDDLFESLHVSVDGSCHGITFTGS